MKGLKLESFAKYEVMTLAGVIMAVLILGNLLKIYTIAADWFWFIAAIALAVEGAIYLVNQKRFDNKYVIIEKSDVEKDPILKRRLKKYHKI